MILVSDIEANGFYDTVTSLHCIVSIDADTLETFISPHDFGLGLGTVISIEEHRKLHEQADKVVGHNWLMYDAPVLAKLFDWEIPALDKVDDTFVMSSLFNPDIPIPKGCSKGAHSLEAWGIRMNFEKGDVTEFDKYTPEMLEYCVRDVQITNKLYRKMQAIRDKHDWELALKLEYSMARIQSNQEIHGLVLDEEKAYSLVEKLEKEIQEIEGELTPQVPAKPKQVGTTVSKPFNLDGSYDSRVTKWFGDIP
jgi:DNA polymerase I-like protein with 3'-5' exonuclease and polymerase domains